MPYNAASQSEHLAPPRVLLFDSIASAQRERSMRHHAHIHRRAGRKCVIGRVLMSSRRWQRLCSWWAVAAGCTLDQAQCALIALESTQPRVASDQ